MVYQDQLETFIAAIRTPRKFRMLFYNFRYYFVVNIVAEQRQIVGNAVLGPSTTTRLLPPQSYHCSGVPG